MLYLTLLLSSRLSRATTLSGAPRFRSSLLRHEPRRDALASPHRLARACAGPV